MSHWETCSAVERSPAKVSGAWVFRNTRVPVTALFENLKDGASIDQFLAYFSGVQRSQVESILECEMTAAAGSCDKFLTRSAFPFGRCIDADQSKALGSIIHRCICDLPFRHGNDLLLRI
jgi:uncharacterized protein (DUF433 family)